MNIRTALVSNTDSRMRKSGPTISNLLVDSLHWLTDAVLRDLDVASYLNPIVLSEEMGVEKPSPEIFLRACREPDSNHMLKPEECVHVGDELDW